MVGVLSHGIPTLTEIEAENIVTRKKVDNHAIPGLLMN
jgi:hypothetical protein